jgi:hypothetical protein
MPALTSLPGICQARHDDLALFFAHKKSSQKSGAPYKSSILLQQTLYITVILLKATVL